MNSTYKSCKLMFVIVYIILISSCTKSPTEFRSFLGESEKIYPGVISNIMVNPGNRRILLTWQPNTDPGVSKYIVYWNNKADSIIVNATSHNSSDTVKAYINTLAESSYNFLIYSFDAKGNKSIPTNIDNAKVYGQQYQTGLLNRAVTGSGYVNGTLSIKWGTPDTVNTTTAIIYTNLLNQNKTIYLKPDSNSLSISDWKLSTKIYYKSSYKPRTNAIDTFTVSNYDSIIIKNLPADKSSWKQVTLPTDAATDLYGTALQNIWDGSPGGYPNIYHTDNVGMPQHFTIDLGRTYNQLSKFSEWGRTDAAVHNPIEFEVWGIADTTKAVTTLPSKDAGWKNQSIAMGWTLLTTIKRSDDGIAGVDVDLINNPPPVRFIRIRVLKNYGNTGNSTMSEISFLYNP